MQKKKHSLIEAIINTLIGLIINVAMQMVVFPLFGIHISIWDNLGIASIFTVISVARTYLVRRFFTKRTEVEITEMKYVINKDF